ncbi:MAG: BatA domain-containing protein [Pseudomonadota bacterium]
MNLAWPGALLALLALALPVIIHVLQQGQHRTIDVATTRFLRNSTRQRWRRLAVDRPLLLALRCLLLAMAVLLLAEPFTTPSTSGASRQSGWVAVSPAVPLDEARALADAGNAQWRWLTDGFPEVDGPPPAASPRDTWSLVAEADAALPAGEPLTVVMPADGARFSARRPPLGRPVEWRLASPAGDTAPSLPEVTIVYDANRQADARWFQAALAAWSDAGLPVQVTIIERGAENALADWTVWLSDDEIPALQAADAPRTVLTDRANPPAHAVMAQDDISFSWQLTRWWDGSLRRLNVGATLAANSGLTGKERFPEQLLAVLAGDRVHEPPPGHPVSAAQLAGAASDDRRNTYARQSLSALFALLVVILWCTERVFSAWPRRGVTDV